MDGADRRERSVDDLLRANGLAGATEAPFPTDGWSGATFTSLTGTDGRRFVLKRTSLTLDWIARATRDDRLREGWFAARAARPWTHVPDKTFPYLGAATDGDGVAILMPDLSAELIAWERPGHDPVVDAETLRQILRAVAQLHSLPWAETLDAEAEGAGAPPPPWCPLVERLTLLTRRSAVGYAAAGNPVGERFLQGWDAFDRLASDAARDLIARLDDDPAPLVAALASLPSRGLHGDLKLANVAVFDASTVGFIDWQMALRAPVAVELGWLLVSNSASLPTPPEAVLEAYREAIDGRTVGDWEAQVDLTSIIGLLLRGWRKGLDAEAGATLASGVAAADDLAWWCDRAVEAAERRL